MTIATTTSLRSSVVLECLGGPFMSATEQPPSRNDSEKEHEHDREQDPQGPPVAFPLVLLRGHRLVHALPFDLRRRLERMERRRRRNGPLQSVVLCLEVVVGG